MYWGAFAEIRTFFLRPIVPDLDNANEGSTTLVITFFGIILRKFFILLIIEKILLKNSSLLARFFNE